MDLDISQEVPTPMYLNLSIPSLHDGMLEEQVLVSTLTAINYVRPVARPSHPHFLHEAGILMCSTGVTWETSRDNNGCRSREFSYTYPKPINDVCTLPKQKGNKNPFPNFCERQARAGGQVP